VGASAWTQLLRVVKVVVIIAALAFGLLMGRVSAKILDVTSIGEHQRLTVGRALILVACSEIDHKRKNLLRSHPAEEFLELDCRAGGTASFLTKARKAGWHAAYLLPTVIPHVPPVVQAVANRGRRSVFLACGETRYATMVVSDRKPPLGSEVAFMVVWEALLLSPIVCVLRRRSASSTSKL
jgi:hypothetical protein